MQGHSNWRQDVEIAHGLQTDTFVDTWEYAVRVIAHSISHLNRGACALVLYRLSDLDWTPTGWGFMVPSPDGNFEKKPIYDAVQETLSTLPTGSQILAPSWYLHDEPITLSVVYQKEDQSYHLLAANATKRREKKVISLSKKMGQLKLIQKTILSKSGLVNQKGLTITAKKLTIDLPPQSIARFTLSKGLKVKELPQKTELNEE